jgi:microcystin-dependent protein
MDKRSKYSLIKNGEMKTTIKLFFLIVCTSLLQTTSAQSLGIGNTAPVEKLEVVGNTKATAMIVSSGGDLYDFLIKLTASGDVGHRKAHGGLGITYIMARQGVFPSQNSAEFLGTNNVQAETVFLGEIRIMAGNVIPMGWVLCDGSTLPLNTNQALFSLIGYSYGGSGPNFAVPDMRALVPVGQGTSAAGYIWTVAQKSN